MPSSPEPQLMQLDDVRLGAPSTASAVEFSAAPEASFARPAPVFEVSSSAGIPDSLLVEARTAAQAAGYAAGWATGIQAARVVSDAELHATRRANDAAEVARQQRLAQAFTALDTAAHALEARAVPAAEQIEELIITSALTIAEQLVGYALRDDVTRADAALRRALSLAPADEPVTVRLSVADHATLQSDGAPDSGRRITLVADESLAPGDAVATCGATEIDARITSGLARIREVLRR